MECDATRAGTCLRCDNRHGCRTPAPLCEALEALPAERLLGGRERMARRGLLERCPECAHYRQCWNAGAFRRALRRARGL